MSRYKYTGKVGIETKTTTGPNKTRIDTKASINEMKTKEEKKQHDIQRMEELEDLARGIVGRN